MQNLFIDMGLSVLFNCPDSILIPFLIASQFGENSAKFQNDFGRTLRHIQLCKSSLWAYTYIHIQYMYKQLLLHCHTTQFFKHASTSSKLSLNTLIGGFWLGAWAELGQATKIVYHFLSRLNEQVNLWILY